MTTPLPFPALPAKILVIMARRPSSPNTVRTLWASVVEEVPDRQKPELVDVEQGLELLKAQGQVLDHENPYLGMVWKLTTLGKLNQGLV
jgi:hypothetical protein